MRTTIVPAQITTVEDRIAGSFTMAQILILMIPVLWTALVFTVLYPTTKIVPYKIGLILSVSLLCLTLALRIKGKIVAEWLQVLLRYQSRPGYYVFNKNDATNRIIDIPQLPIERKAAKKISKQTAEPATDDVDVTDLIKLEHLIDTGKVAFHYQFESKHS